MPNPASFDTAQTVKENFAPLSRENGEVPNTNTTTNDFDGNSIVNTLISLLCGLCNKDYNTQEMLGLDGQNNTTQLQQVEPNRNDDLNNSGEHKST